MLLSSSSDRVVCSCEICSASDMKYSSSSSSSRRLVSVQSAAYQFAGMVQYIFEEYESVTTSTSFSVDTVTSSIIVLVTFAMVWLIIVLIVPIKTMVYKRIDKQKDAKSKGNMSVVPEDVAHSITLEKRLRDYIKTCIPTVYHEEQGYMKRLLNQLLRNHLYINLFLTNEHATFFLSYMEALKVVTLLTSSMFILVILFNLEYPSDDNTCHNYQTEADCLNRKEFRGRTYCIWEENECIFSEGDFSIYTIIFLAWFELLILAPLGSLVFFIFDEFILAPTPKSVENQLKVNHGVSLGRRLSQIGNGISSQVSE